jgi:hypothetical protein
MHMLTGFRLAACDVAGGRDRRIDKIAGHEPRCGEFRPPREVRVAGLSH